VGKRSTAATAPFDFQFGAVIARREWCGLPIASQWGALWRSSVGEGGCVLLFCSGVRLFVVLRQIFYIVVLMWPRGPEREAIFGWLLLLPLSVKSQTYFGSSCQPLGHVPVRRQRISIFLKKNKLIFFEKIKIHWKNGVLTLALK
jgi:hypothetical protein